MASEKSGGKPVKKKKTTVKIKLCTESDAETKRLFKQHRVGRRRHDMGETDRA